MPRVAVIQMEADPASKVQTIKRSLGLIRSAVAGGARLIVLPELAATRYLLSGVAELESVAEPVSGGEALDAWCEAARVHDIYVVAGFAERDTAGRFYNSAAVIGPQGVLGIYRKLHLFDWERRVFLPGDRGLPVFDLPWCRIGVLICYDLRFVEAVRLLALRGVDLLCVPTTWTDLYKPDPWDERGWCQANYLAMVHAYTNRIYVACANRCGQEAHVRYLGCSLIVSPYGKVLAGPAPPSREVVLWADIDPDHARDKSLGPDGDLWADRRADTYLLCDLKEGTT